MRADLKLGCKGLGKCGLALCQVPCSKCPVWWYCQDQFSTLVHRKIFDGGRVFQLFYFFPILSRPYPNPFFKKSPKISGKNLIVPSSAELIMCSPWMTILETVPSWPHKIPISSFCTISNKLKMVLLSIIGCDHQIDQRQKCLEDSAFRLESIGCYDFMVR